LYTQLSIHRRLSPHVSVVAAARPDLARIVADLNSLIGPAPDPVPLRRWRDRVAEEYKTRARTTRTRMGQALRELLELATKDDPDATTAAVTSELITKLSRREGRAATTNGLLSSLHAACTLAAQWGYLSPDSLDGATWTVAPDAPRRRHHPRGDVARVLDHLRGRIGTWEGHRLYALAVLIAYTGVRKMEALRAKIGDVDLRRGFFFVRPNGGELKTPRSEAPVPLPAVAIAALGAWIALLGPGEEWLFPGKKRRGPWVGGMHGRRAADQLVAAGLAVGVKGFTPQSLRHSLATHLHGYWGLSRGQVKLVLRHTDEATTGAHYIHPDLANLRKLVHRFDFIASPRRPARRHRRRLLKRPRPRAAAR
jgi:integrase